MLPSPSNAASRVWIPVLSITSLVVKLPSPSVTMECGARSASETVTVSPASGWPRTLRREPSKANSSPILNGCGTVISNTLGNVASKDNCASLPSRKSEFANLATTRCLPSSTKLWANSKPPL